MLGANYVQYKTHTDDYDEDDFASFSESPWSSFFRR